MMIEAVTFILLTAAEVPLLAFIFYYVTEPVPGTRWRRRFADVRAFTTTGKLILAQKVAWFLLFGLILAVRLFGDFPGREWVALALYTFLVGMFWAVFIDQRVVQVEHERAARRGRDS